MTTTLNPILPHEPNTASVQRPERLKFAPHILLHSGTWLEQHSAWEDDPLIDGIKLALVHSGQMQCRVAGQAVRHVVQPSLCAFGNLGDYAISHRFQPDIPLRYTILQLESDGQDQHAELFPTALKYRAAAAENGHRSGVKTAAGVVDTDRQLPVARRYARFVSGREGDGADSHEPATPVRHACTGNRPSAALPRRH